MSASSYQGFLFGANRSEDVVVASAADNCRFDERAGPERWQRFEDVLAGVLGGRAPSWDDWAEAYRLYMEQCCHVARPGVPDAFLDVNRSAWADGISENQSFVRVEDLSRALNGSNLELRDLDDLVRRADDNDADAQQAVRVFFEAWNERRDARPAFVAFADEVLEEIEDHDWPHALRDRLGLGHFGYAEGSAQPIALMRYSVSDVLDAQTRLAADTGCALPTVLDGGMHEFFFPVPREQPFGATVHLVPEQAETLTAELLHCRVDYKRQHLYRLGEITRSGRPDSQRLREARDLHLYALREACRRDDFGEPLEGRT